MLFGVLVPPTALSAKTECPTHLSIKPVSSHTTPARDEITSRESEKTWLEKSLLTRMGCSGFYFDTIGSKHTSPYYIMLRSISSILTVRYAIPWFRNQAVCSLLSSWVNVMIKYHRSGPNGPFHFPSVVLSVCGFIGKERRGWWMGAPPQ